MFVVLCNGGKIKKNAKAILKIGSYNINPATVVQLEYHLFQKPLLKIHCNVLLFVLYVCGHMLVHVHTQLWVM